MTTKMLNVNGKVLLGVFSVVLVITAIAIIPLVFSGSGKVKANGCMADCMKSNSEYFDARSELTHACQEYCGIETQVGNCESHPDNCCVPFTGDPDCGGAAAGCGAEVCDDGLDNDCDLLVDADDPDCGPTPTVCVVVTVYDNSEIVPEATVEIFDIEDPTSVWAGTTGTDGKVNVPCDPLSVTISYFAKATKDSMQGQSLFTTDKTDPPEEVTVDIG